MDALLQILGLSHVMGETMRTRLERFEEKYIAEPMSGCWLWIGCMDAKGYGRFKSNNKRADGAYRWAYEHFVGPVPDGLQLDHLCRVRCCVNPAHLEVVTQAENIRRGEVGKNMKTKTHCPYGHPYDEVNTRIVGGGRRECRTCRNTRKRQKRLDAKSKTHG
jgi:hypothetical protein